MYKRMIRGFQTRYDLKNSNLNKLNKKWNCCTKISDIQRSALQIMISILRFDWYGVLVYFFEDRNWQKVKQGVDVIPRHRNEALVYKLNTVIK